MSTYNQLIFKYRPLFEEKGLYVPTLRAFLFELCNEKNIDLYLHKDEEADKEIAEKYEAGVKRLLKNEPLNYVLGYSYFYGYKFIVDERVLIPRYETEELVSLVLSNVDEYYSDYKEIKAVDIGTGCGAIAVALSKEESRMKLMASDISEEALVLARRNAANNEAKVEFLAGDMLEPFIERGLKFDILISNPPYIPVNETMEASVVDFEPHVALFGGDDGLFFYRRIFEKAAAVLHDRAMLFFEIGYDQRERISALAAHYFPNGNIEVIKDINNKDRMLKIKLF